MRNGSGRTGSSVWRDIGVSWLALKPWVKAWLFFLNAVFVAALAFLPHPAAIWTLVAYGAAALLLAAIAYRQRGLSRLAGLGHILPWTPLTVYLGLWLTTDLLGPRVAAELEPARFGYLLVLLASVGLCLAFDVYDLVRWLRGERYIMGSEEAVRAGASSAAQRLTFGN